MAAKCPEVLCDKNCWAFATSASGRNGNDCIHLSAGQFASVWWRGGLASDCALDAQYCTVHAVRGGGLKVSF